MLLIYGLADRAARYRSYMPDTARWHEV